MENTTRFAANRRLDVVCLGRFARRLLRAADRRAPRGRDELRQVPRRLVGEHGVRLRAARPEGRRCISRVGNDAHRPLPGRDDRQAKAATRATSASTRSASPRPSCSASRTSDTFPLIFLRENCADMAIDEHDIDEAYIALVARAAHHRHALLDRARQPHQQPGARPRARATTCAPCSTSTTGRCCGASPSAATARPASSPSDGVTAHLQKILPKFDLVIGTDRGVPHRGRQPRDHGVAARGARGHATRRSWSSAARWAARSSTAAIPASLDDAFNGEGVTVEVLNVLGAGDAFSAGLPVGLGARRRLRALRALRQRLRRARRVAPRLRAGDADARRARLLHRATPRRIPRPGPGRDARRACIA